MQLYKSLIQLKGICSVYVWTLFRNYITQFILLYTIIFPTFNRFVHIAVMDYYPTTIYTKEPKFWPVIDDALKRAAIERGIEVKLLLSNWTSTRPQMKDYLRSLTDLSRYDAFCTSI